MFGDIDDNDNFDLNFVCRWFGGSRKPLHPSTVYRAIDDGRISRPFKPTPNANRWTGKQLKADMRRMLEADRAPSRSPNPRAMRNRAVQTRRSSPGISIKSDRGWKESRRRPAA